MGEDCWSIDTHIWGFPLQGEEMEYSQPPGEAWSSRGFQKSTGTVSRGSLERLKVESWG